MDEEIEIPARSACVWCNKETALALFGVVLGLAFVVMSLDTLRRMRMSTVESEAIPND